MDLQTIGEVLIFAGVASFLLLALAVIIRWPPLGLTLMIAWDLFARLVTDDLMLLAFGLAGIAGLTLLVSAFRIKPSGLLGLGSKTLHLPPVILLILSTIFLAVGVIRGNPASLFTGDYFHFAIEIVLIFYVALFALQTRKDVNLFVSTFAIVTFLFTLTILMLYATGQILTSPAGSLRSDGLFQLTLGLSYPLVHFLFFFCYLLFEPRRWRKVMLFLLVMMLLATLVLTFKRSAWIATLLAIPWAFYLLPQKGGARGPRLRRAGPARTILLLAALIPLAAVGFSRYLEANYGADLSEVLISRVEALFVGESTSVQGRSAQFIDAAELIAVNPVGYGLGSEFDVFNPGEEVLRLSRGAYSKEVRSKIHYIHNVFLHYSLQIGVIGALAYYAFVFLVLRRMVHSARRRALAPAERAIILGCLSACLALLLEGATTVASNTHYLSLLMVVGYRLACLPAAQKHSPAVASA